MEKNPLVNDDGGNFSTIGERLRSERKRLGHSQALLAVQAGVSKETQINYEKAVSTPNADYLAKLAALGIDVLYVVTGQRTPIRQHVITAVEDDQDSVGSRKVLLLDEPLQTLIENYTAADEEGRRAIEATAALAAKANTKHPAPRPSKPR